MTKLAKLKKGWDDVQTWAWAKIKSLPPWAIAVLLALYEASEFVLHWLRIPHWHP